MANKRSPEFMLEVRELLAALAELAAKVITRSRCSSDLADRTETALRRVFKRTTSCLSQDPEVPCLGGLAANSYPADACGMTATLQLALGLGVALIKGLSDVLWGVGQGSPETATKGHSEMERAMRQLGLLLQTLFDTNRR